MPLVIRGNILQSRGRVDWLPDGNATQPALTFSTDPDTGLYRPGNDQIALSTGGTDRFLVDANGTRLTGTTPSAVVAASGTWQYAGGTVKLLNNATEATRRGATLGTFIRDGDGTDSYFAIDSVGNTESYHSTLARYDLSDDRWSLNTNNTERLVIESDGNVTMTSNLLVAGDVFAFASDRRLKKDFSRVENALESVKNMTGYRYTWRDDVDGLPMRGRDLGLVAQEVQDAGIPECIVPAPFDLDTDGTSKSGEAYLSIQYNKLHAVLVEAIKELDEKLEQIRAELRTT